MRKQRGGWMEVEAGNPGFSVRPVPGGNLYRVREYANVGDEEKGDRYQCVAVGVGFVPNIDILSEPVVMEAEAAPHVREVHPSTPGVVSQATVGGRAVEVTFDKGFVFDLPLYENNLHFGTFSDEWLRDHTDMHTGEIVVLAQHYKSLRDRYEFARGAWRRWEEAHGQLKRSHAGALQDKENHFKRAQQEEQERKLVEQERDSARKAIDELMAGRKRRDAEAAEKETTIKVLADHVRDLEAQLKVSKSSYDAAITREVKHDREMIEAQAKLSRVDAQCRASQEEITRERIDKVKYAETAAQLRSVLHHVNTFLLDHWNMGYIKPDAFREVGDAVARVLGFGDFRRTPKDNVPIGEPIGPAQCLETGGHFFVPMEGAPGGATRDLCRSCHFFRCLKAFTIDNVEHSCMYIDGHVDCGERRHRAKTTNFIGWADPVKERDSVAVAALGSCSSHGHGPDHEQNIGCVNWKPRA